jgi:hypothetical protein
MNIAAFTPSIYPGAYPPYVSINRVDDIVRITIRADSGEYMTTHVDMKPEQWAVLRREIIECGEI